MSLRQDRPEEALRNFRRCLDLVEEPVWRARTEAIVKELSNRPPRPGR